MAGMAAKRSGWLIAMLLGVAAIVLIGTGFVNALPSMISGASRQAPIVVSQPPAVDFAAGPLLDSGYDVSFPQCGRLLPAPTEGFAIVGIHGGRPFADQPCFPDQAWWAQQHNGFAVYMNTEYTGEGDPAALGREMADDVAIRIRMQYLPEQTPVWLDVETDNYWRGTPEQHNALISAIANRLTELGHPVGVYSAPNLWRTITGGADPGMPIWLAIGKGTREKAENACGRVGFGGQTPSLVQWVQVAEDGALLDHNLICPGVTPTGLLLPTSSWQAGT